MLVHQDDVHPVLQEPSRNLPGTLNVADTQKSAVFANWTFMFWSHLCLSPPAPQGRLWTSGPAVSEAGPGGTEKRAEICLQAAPRQHSGKNSAALPRQQKQHRRCFLQAQIQPLSCCTAESAAARAEEQDWQIVQDCSFVSVSFEKRGTKDKCSRFLTAKLASEHAESWW